MINSLIEAIDNDEISVKEQVADRLTTLSNYIKGRVKTCKNMDSDECLKLVESLEMLKNEVYYWF